MIYFVRTTDHGIMTATAEDAPHAARLDAQGWTRCTPAAHRAAWAERDRVARLAMRSVDRRAAEAREVARIVGRLPGKVYPA